MKILLLALFSLLASTSMAFAPQGLYRPVPDDQVLDVLIPVPASPEQNLDQKISLLIWNTHKGESGAAWAHDLSALSAGKQFVLLQEGMNDSFMPGALQAINPLGWLMAQNFYMQGNRDATGVITGQEQIPNSTSFLRSRDTEPVTQTGKVSLFTTYHFKDGSSLLLINIHAINFVGLPPFYRQIDDIAAVIATWKDKVIFAGDFNTWIANRTEYLVKKMNALGLSEVRFEHDPREMVLDHIFVRGCSVTASQVHGEITTSDHKPLTADLDCNQSSASFISAE